MTPQEWDDVKRLFLAALDRPAGERAAWIGQCGGTQEMRAEVERLVAAHLAAGSFIERPLADLHGESEPPPGRWTGAWLGQYRLDAVIGAGGMGEVYRAHDAELSRAVAIKMVGRDESGAYERLRREARHASHLNHPNICTIHHVGDAEGRPYIVMELVDGRPLSEAIPESGLPAPAAIAYAVQILDALAHAHEQGVIHRDLKSANAIVRPSGQVKLLDFGLARHLDGAAPGSSVTSTLAGPMTAAGGTLPYMAPEVLRGEPADASSDLWAFGVLLYEMLTGRLPFAGNTAFEIGRAILDGEPTPLPSSVPAALASCVMRCLSQDSARRPRTAAEIRAQLEALASAPRAPVSRRRVAIAAAIALMLLTVIGIAAWRWTRAAAPRAPTIQALAVLPLENISGDPAQDYFADGVTESLIRELGRIARLRVTPQTTAMRYRATGKPLRELARELQVDAVLYGTVMRESDRVRIAATLVRGGGDRLWTERFERPAREILALQRDIVRVAADRIAVPLTPQEDARLARVRAVDPHVHESYLKGRFHWNRRTQASLAVAVEHFRAAVAADPTYAPAHVGLADCYNQLGTVMVGSGSPAAMRPQAMAAAIAALQIDPMLAEAHAALGYARHYDWQWEAAERSFLRALELDANNPLTYVWYANYLASRGRLDEAIAHVKRARQLDPLSLVVITNVGWTLSYARRYDEAIAAYRDALALDAGYVQANQRLASAYAEVGQFDAAVAHAETVARLTGRSPASLIGLASVYAQAGRRREAERLVADVARLARTQYVSPYSMAQAHLRLGDVDGGFAWLERAYAERSNGMVYLGVESALALARSDPRYQDLLRRVGLVR